MKRTWAFGWRYLLVGVFLDKPTHSIYFMAPGVSLRLQFALPELPRGKDYPETAETNIVLCKICLHPASAHHAMSDGYTRGDHGELIPKSRWDCFECDSGAVDPKHEFVAVVVPG